MTFQTDLRFLSPLRIYMIDNITDANSKPTYQVDPIDTPPLNWFSKSNSRRANRTWTPVLVT